MKQIPLPEMEHITKSSAGMYANEDVDLSVGQGEIYTLLGENGAGKTTLTNIPFSIHQADRGGICFKSRNVEFKSSGETVARGIGMVHQHLSLAKKMMVLNNAILGLKGGGIMADRKPAGERLTSLAAAYGLLVGPEIPIHTLPVGGRQKVEILKTLYRDVGLLVLGEPAGVLTPQETKNFFGILRRLRGEGYGTIIIVHRLGEVMDISDRMTVLCDGRRVRSLATKETTLGELSTCMIGRELKAEKKIRKSATGETALGFKDVRPRKKHSTKMSLDHTSLAIRRGETLGITEVGGNGQEESVEVTAGVRRAKSGRMGHQGRGMRKDNAKERSRAGISYISDDRHGDSLVMDMTVEDSLISGDFSREPFSREIVLNYKQAGKRARETLDKYGIKTPSKNGIKTPVKLMNSGSQQKAILSREISGKTDLIVTSQLTRGLNVGATRFVHEILLRQRDVGRYILLISANLDEILGIGDYMAVMYEGRIIRILNREEADVHKIGLLMGGVVREAANEQEIKSI